MDLVWFVLYMEMITSIIITVNFLKYINSILKNHIECFKFMTFLLLVSSNTMDKILGNNTLSSEALIY